MVPSTMSPLLKYLMVSSIAARNAASDPMSLTATLGVELACVLLVMCGLAPDADRERCGRAGNPCNGRDLQDSPVTSHMTAAERTRTRRSVQLMRVNPRGQLSLVPIGYRWRGSVGRLGPASAGADRHVERDPQRGGARHRGADHVTDGVELA